MSRVPDRTVTCRALSLLIALPLLISRIGLSPLTRMSSTFSAGTQTQPHRPAHLLLRSAICLASKSPNFTSPTFGPDDDLLSARCGSGPDSLDCSTERGSEQQSELRDADVGFDDGRARMKHLIVAEVVKRGGERPNESVSAIRDHTGMDAV